MIPKIIHYVWFGNKPFSNLQERCINSWVQNCKDYTFMVWNESNFDTNYNEFTKTTYENKSYAQLSDLIRLFCLFNYGGIYLDTDVELLGNLDSFLHHRAFTGFENIGYPFTAVLGAEKNNSVIGELLSYYDDKIYTPKENWKEELTNTMIVSDYLSTKGIDRYKNEYQEIENISIYPKYIFCPNIRNEKTNRINKDTIAIHYMTGEWQS